MQFYQVLRAGGKTLLDVRAIVMAARFYGTPAHWAAEARQKLVSILRHGCEHDTRHSWTIKGYLIL